MKERDVLVVGAGPAGLAASIEASKAGADVLLVDLNLKPGGQLFKQIHKFFGSKEHMAKIRGINIGTELLKQAQDLGVNVHLNAPVMGIYEGKEVTTNENNMLCHYKADSIIVATGACENTIPFRNWTLPGDRKSVV